jgi:hypothetical protein
MENPVSPTFCILPWMHVFADESGTLYPCCRSVDTQLPNVDESNRPYRIQDENGLADGWNSQYMRTLRLAMLAGERPSPCDRCYAIEDSGIQSYRQTVNGQYTEQIPELVSHTGAEGEAPHHFLSFDLRLGNLCNLRCRMCSPHSSKALIQEFASYFNVSPRHPYFEGLRQLDWFSSDAFWRMFDRYSVHLERLHFAGGEPLLIPQMFDFLKRLIRDERSQRIRLSYNTNLTVLPEYTAELWSRFQSVRVTTSVDGYEKVNSFIRYPADWQTIDRNLHLLDAEKERFHCTGGLGLNVTVQAYNVLYLDALIEYAALQFEHIEAPNLSLLRHPDYLSIQVLSPALKEQAASRLHGFLQRFEERWPARWRGEPLDRLKAAIHGVLHYMTAADRSDRLPEFRKWTRHLDENRRQRMEDVLPELAPLCEEQDTAVQRAAG